MGVADITAIVISLLTAGGLLWDRFSSRRKAQADAKKTEADAEKAEADTNETIRQTVMSLIEPLKKRVDELQAEVTALQAENADLKDWIERLVAQVKGLGGVPAKLVRKAKE